jgi:structure-specific endonuclease subunit SLX1
MSFFVYLLECTDGSTYVGATVDLNHRLRQHNGEIKGGAHATTVKVNRGNVWPDGKTWRRICHVAGFPDWQAALQFEWRWKQVSRKYLSTKSPLERRAKALHAILLMDRPTSKAKAFSEWPTPPEVVTEVEEDGICSLFDHNKEINNT